MSQCIMCGSYAINEHLHGRERGVDTDLCDVCYWRKRASELQERIDNGIRVGVKLNSKRQINHISNYEGINATLILD